MVHLRYVFTRLFIKKNFSAEALDTKTFSIIFVSSSNRTLYFYTSGYNSIRSGTDNRYIFRNFSRLYSFDR